MKYIMNNNEMKFCQIGFGDFCINTPNARFRRAPAKCNLNFKKKGKYRLSMICSRSKS